LSQIACLSGELVLGVDTHLQTHTAVVIDLLGRQAATATFPTTRRGLTALIGWAQRLGQIRRAGVEGTGSYGVGLTRRLPLEGINVIEVTRPKRRDRRHQGKTDTLDALAAARVVLAGDASALPKSRDGVIEAIRVLRNTRAGAIKARTQTVLQMRSIIVTAPDDTRAQLRDLTTRQLVEHCARRRRARPTDAASAARLALRTLARRYQALDEEIGELDQHLLALTRRAAPRLLAETGVGPETAARLLILAGDNPERLSTDAALAALCGASPIEASSGKTQRHRLNRGGDRQGNNALWTIATNRMIHDPETRAYVAKRTQDGKSTKEIRRCLMRHLARRLYPLLIADITDLHDHPLT
jgi:transposase